MDWTDCPIVDVDPEKQGGAPLIRGTRAPVSAILNNHNSGLSNKWIAENFGVSLEQVRAILAFSKKVQPQNVLVH